MRRVFFVLASLLCTAGPALAQAPAASPPAAPASPAHEALRRVEEKLLHFDWGLMNGSVQRGGKEQKLGYFGGDGQELFAGSPSALADLHAYRNYRVAGTVLYALGVAALVTDLVMIFAKNGFVYSSTNGTQGGFWVLFGVGAALSLPGGILMQVANSRLADAVRHYNTDVFAQEKKRLGLRLLPVEGGLAAGLAGSF